MSCVRVFTLLVLLSLSVVSCEVVQQHVVCAPRLKVERCLQEVYWGQNGGTGMGQLGPYCLALNDWARVHDWGYGGKPGVQSGTEGRE